MVTMILQEIEIKIFDVLTGNKLFKPIKRNQELYEKFVEISRNDYNTIGNLFDYLHHQNYYKLIGLNLSRQTNASIPQ